MCFMIALYHAFGTFETDNLAYVNISQTLHFKDP